MNAHPDAQRIECATCDQVLVSVIIPCYNQAHYLAQAIKSVIDQTFDQWELIIVNDGSTDNTREVASRFAQTDARVHYVEQQNRGLSAARNRGLGLANGKYIQFLDSDDFIAPIKLAIQVELLEGQAAQIPSIAYCDYFYCEGTDPSKLLNLGDFNEPRFILRRPLHDLAVRWETELSIPIHCFLFDIRLFRERGIMFDETLPNHEDWDCWLRLFALDPPLLHSDKKLAVYRIQEGSMSRDIALMWKGVEMVCKKQVNALPHDPETRALIVAKRESMRRIYQGLKVEQGWKRLPPTLREYFERNVPWPIQRAVYRFLGR